MVTLPRYLIETILTQLTPSSYLNMATVSSKFHSLVSITVSSSHSLDLLRLHPGFFPFLTSYFDISRISQLSLPSLPADLSLIKSLRNLTHLTLATSPRVIPAELLTLPSLAYLHSPTATGFSLYSLTNSSIKPSQLRDLHVIPDHSNLFTIQTIFPYLECLSFVDSIVPFSSCKSLLTSLPHLKHLSGVSYSLVELVGSCPGIKSVFVSEQDVGFFDRRQAQIFKNVNHFYGRSLSVFQGVDVLKAKSISLFNPIPNEIPVFGSSSLTKNVVNLELDCNNNVSWCGFLGNCFVLKNLKLKMCDLSQIIDVIPYLSSTINSLSFQLVSFPINQSRNSEIFCKLKELNPKLFDNLQNFDFESLLAFPRYCVGWRDFVCLIELLGHLKSISLRHLSFQESGFLFKTKNIVKIKKQNFSLTKVSIMDCDHLVNIARYLSLCANIISISFIGRSCSVGSIMNYLDLISKSVIDRFISITPIHLSSWRIWGLVYLVSVSSLLFFVSD
ncbi:hypothetical protein P9112_003043 [Eukaryota sp. TZLM1-RC]